LCDLGGKTRREAARQLGVPDGSVASRLARARALLAKRLARRGITLTGGVLAAVLAQNTATAGVPAPVVASTIKAASVFAAGQAAAADSVPPKVAALTEGVLKVMLLSKLKIATAVLLVLACVGATLVTFLPEAAGQQPAAAGVKAESYRVVVATKQDDGQRVVKKVAVPPGAVAGVVSAVDAKANRISVSIATTVRAQGVATKKEKDIELANVPVRKDAKLTIAGKEGKLADIAVGNFVIMELEAVGGMIAVTHIEALRK
jgi:hypothetical protein